MSTVCPPTPHPSLLHSDLTPGDGCTLHFFDRQQNFNMRRRILICSDAGFSGWVACGGGLMETRKAHQNAPNKCGGELHHRPPSQFYKPDRSTGSRIGGCMTVGASGGRTNERLLALGFIPSFYFDAFLTLHECILLKWLLNYCYFET